MKREKLNFFKQLWIALFRPDQYGSLITIGNGRMIGFVVLFSLLYSIVWMGSLMISLDLDAVAQILKEELPDFYLEDGELHLEEPYQVAAQNSFICADSEIEKFELSDLEYIMDTTNYEGILLISRKNLLLYEDHKYRELNFSDLHVKGTRDELFEKSISFIRKASMMLSVIIFPFLAIIHFIAALFLALFAGIFSAIFQRSLSGGQVYRIGIYTYTMLMLAGLIFGVYLSVVPTVFAQFIYFILGAVYLVVGVIYTNNRADAKRQEMAQRTAGLYNGYGEPMGYYGQDAFSTEPIGFQGQENQVTGTYGNWPLEQGEDTVMINGTVCQKSDLDLVDKYLLVGLKESAMDTLCQLLNCTKEAAEEVIMNWQQYYK